jgi:hypothetical protein
LFFWRRERICITRSISTCRPAGAGEHADDLVADLLGVGVEVEQDAGGDALVLPHQAEQDVLGADVVVPQRERLAEGELENLLGARRERDLARRDLVALPDDARDLRAHLFDRDVERLEHARGKSLLLTEQAEKNVFRADVVVLESTSLVLGENHHLTSPLCESLEQPRLPFLETLTADGVSAAGRGETSVPHPPCLSASGAGREAKS